MPWITNEDAALKWALQGIRVTDANSPPDGRQVPVYYELPETEVQDFSPPCIVIKHLGWFRDPTREHSGYIKLPYAPEGWAPWWADNPALAGPGQGLAQPGQTVPSYDPNDSPYRSYFPIPYNFDYQVEVYCRLMHEHMAPIVTALAQYGRLHPHWGYLNVPQDGTKRTLFLNGGPELEYGKDQDDKHLLTTTYNVRVCSELIGTVDAPVQFGGSFAYATALNIDLSVYSDMADLTFPELQESFGVLSVGMASRWNTQ